MNDTKDFYIYVGKADPPHGPWKFIPDTPEERQRAIEDGYTAVSTMSFTYEPEEGKPEPLRRGSLFLDLDYKYGAGANATPAPEVAIGMARDMIERLGDKIQINPECWRYWISGKKGCHIEIPAAVFGGEAGHPELPEIHKRMVIALQGLAYAPSPLPNILDLSLYSMGRGHLLRCPNLKRADNGRYKVPVSADEFFNLDYPALERLTMEQRPGFDPGTKEPVLSPRMAEIYDAAVQPMRAFSNRSNPISGLEALLNCRFMAHCSEDRTTLPEPHWWVMISILTTFGAPGRELAHEMSRGYPGYSFEETELKMNTAAMKQGRGPISCGYIRGLPFDCGQQCGVRSPADLWKYERSDETRRSMSFINKPDGLYRQSERGDGELIKVCSPLKVVGKVRSPEGSGWARLLEIETSDGRHKEVYLPMRETKGRGDAAIGILLDRGLDIWPGSKSSQYLMEYIHCGAPTDCHLMCVDRIGWFNNTYILPDTCYGAQLEEKVHFQTEVSDHIYKTAGTLADWKEHVGRYCQGNSSLILTVCYALTGPLLRLIGLEGGGIHWFGPSATGKTTLLIVGSSVCGGEDFLLQWRTTHNAMEAIAAQRNDNFLALDEISQANSDTVNDLTYTLANGQGKKRMKIDASLRKPYQWRVNFLSTGELTITDKIQECGKYTAKAGQEVRVIDLPIDAGDDRNAFQNLHGLPGAAEFSQLLRLNARQYYGRPMRAFLEKLCDDLEGNRTRIMNDMKVFYNEYCPSDAEGQVKRVTPKLALIAAAGELAIAFGVLPFEAGSAKKAAAEWFRVWLDNRKGHGNLEIIKVIERIKEHLVRHSTRYIDLDFPSNYRPPQVEGYIWRKGGKKYVFMRAPFFSDLIRGVSRRALINALDSLGYLAHTTTGTVQEHVSINKTRERGMLFIASAWEGEPESPEDQTDSKTSEPSTPEVIFD